jgi:hypothetical protein
MFLYHIAVAKPKTSKCWTIMVNSNGVPIVRTGKEHARSAGLASLEGYIGPDNKYQNPADWEVRAAKVVL